MSQSILYAKSLSLLLEEVQSAADLTLVRSGLLRVRRFSRSHDLRLELIDGTLAINGIRLARPLAGLQRLITAMTAHGVAQINVNAGAVPRELLKLAMLLSRPSHAGKSHHRHLRGAARRGTLGHSVLSGAARAKSRVGGAACSRNRA